MMNKNLNKYADRIVNAFLKNKIISPLPRKFTKKISNAQKFRRLCESKINKFTLGIELEVCYLIKKNFFNSKSKATKKNIKKFITHILPCIEVVGYRQKKKGIKSLGDLCSDFGANIKFILGQKKKFSNQNVKNLKTTIANKKINQVVNGNTNTVYIDPMNSLRFVLRKLQIDKIKLNKDFYVFTGSSVGVVPILSKGIYKGVINKLGSVSTKIN